MVSLTEWLDKNYADDTVEAFIQKSVENGIDIIRIFDCLNDLRNIKTALQATKKAGAQAQVALVYTIGDAYTDEYWMHIAKKIERMGADSICIKDMAGLLLPYKAYELVKNLKKATNLPIELHSHCTSGVAPMAYLKAIEAGVDIIDCAIHSFIIRILRIGVSGLQTLQNQVSLSLGVFVFCSTSILP